MSGTIIFHPEIFERLRREDQDSHQRSTDQIIPPVTRTDVEDTEISQPTSVVTPTSSHDDEYVIETALEDFLSMYFSPHKLNKRLKTLSTRRLEMPS